MAGQKRYYEQVDAFKEGKSSQRKSDSMWVSKGDNYKEIYSYSTPIAFEGKDGKVYMNKDKYSHTTSSQQSVIRKELDPVELSREEFEKKRVEVRRGEQRCHEKMVLFMKLRMKKRSKDFQTIHEKELMKKNSYKVDDVEDKIFREEITTKSQIDKEMGYEKKKRSDVYGK